MLAKLSGKKTLWVVLFLALAALGGGYYYYQTVYLAAQSATTTATLQTATARKGDLVIYASGTGTLVALNEADLSFKTSGQVKEISVKVGDVVQAGDVLAKIDDTSLQIKYTQAKRNLLELTSPAALATAQEAIADAEVGVQSAINTLAYLISPEVYYWEQESAKTDQRILNAEKALQGDQNNADLKKKLDEAKAYLDFVQDKLKGSHYYYQHEYLPDRFTTYDRVTGKKYLSAPTDADIASARANLDKAKAAVKEAQYYYDALLGNEIPADATGAGLTTLEQAQLDLAAAQADLDGAQLVAPINGTIMSINTNVGDTAGTSAVMTIADLSQQDLEVFLDVSDWENVKTGYETEVVFDILPDNAYTGVITQVDPGLYASGNSSAIRAIVQLKDIQPGEFNLPLGSSAAVDVIAGKALGAVLVPVEAVREAGPGQYAVFVIENGEPRLHLVEVGIMDVTYAEIKSGVKAGDTVTTGIAETR